MKKLLVCLAVSMISLSTFAASINCGGTEPFWNASVKKDVLTFSSPELVKSITLKVLSTQQAAGYSNNNIMVIKTKYTRLSVIAGECSDGMSENSFSHHAIFEKNGVVFGGCCNLK